MVIAVTLCLLLLFMVIAEYFRVNIIVQGVRDAANVFVGSTRNTSGRFLRAAPAGKINLTQLRCALKI